MIEQRFIMEGCALGIVLLDTWTGRSWVLNKSLGVGLNNDWRELYGGPEVNYPEPNKVVNLDKEK